MQILFRTLLAIYLAHLFTDFVFQTPRLVEQKRRGNPIGYFLHGLTHYLTAILLTGFFIRGSFFSVRTHLVLVSLTLIHLLIDLAKIRLTQRGQLPGGPLAYVSDQMLHLLTVILAAWLFSPGMPFVELTALAGRWRDLPNAVLAVPAVYIGIVFGGGYLIRSLTRTLSEGLKTHSPDKSGEQLQNAGLYIGWLERFLVITALLLQSPATVGLILTAKAIARYPEFKSERFAEYFLIGTLLSLSLAILGGAFLAKLLFHQVRLSG